MDKRVIRTKKVLRETLIALMKEKPIKEIQVTELTQKAKLDRTTFYKHYNNIEDIIDEMQTEQLEIFASMLKEKEKSRAEFLKIILDSIEYAKDLFSANGLIPETFKDAVVTTAKTYGLKAWRDKLGKSITPKEAELSYEALLSGALHVALTENVKASRKLIILTIIGMADAYIYCNS